MFFRFPTALKLSEVRQPSCAAVIGYVTDTDSTWLRQCSPVWCSCPPAESSPVSSGCSALSVTCGSMTTSLMSSVTCTGYAFQREYTTDWPCLSSTVVTAWCGTSLLAHDLHWTDKAEALQVYVLGFANDWSHRERDFTRFATVDSMWWRHGHGTSFLLVLLQHLHWLRSKDSWRHSCLLTIFLWLCILIMYRVLEAILLMPRYVNLYIWIIIPLIVVGVITAGITAVVT